MSQPAARTPEVPVPGVGGYLRCPSGRSLFCVSHAGVAANSTVERGTIVLWQTCSEERKASHRTMVRLAGALAAAGFTTHRLDLPGCGESTGDLARLRWADWLADAAFAEKALLGEGGNRSVDTNWVGGLRLGAAVAGVCAKLSATNTGSARWLAIAPILQGAGWLRHLRTRRSIRSELTAAPDVSGVPDAASSSHPTATKATAGVLDAGADGEDFDGMVLGPGMLADLAALDLATQLRRNSGAVVQVGAAKTVGRDFSALSAPGRTLVISAVRQEPVWERGEAVNDAPLLEAVLMAVTTAPNP